MARYNKYGFAYDQIICEDFALPDGTGETPNSACTNTVTLNAPKSGQLKIVICASSVENELTSAATLRFTPLFGTTSSTCTVRGVGTVELKEGNITLYNTAGSATTTDYPADSTWAAGTRMVEILIPNYLAQTYKYMDLNIAASADESGDKIEAYLVSI